MCLCSLALLAVFDFEYFDLEPTLTGCFSFSPVVPFRPANELLPNVSILISSAYSIFLFKLLIVECHAKKMLVSRPVVREQVQKLQFLISSNMLSI